MITAETLQEKCEKGRKLLASKKKTREQYERLIDELVHTINEAVIYVHQLEQASQLTYDELEAWETRHRTSMDVANQLFEQYLRLMATKGVIADPAQGIADDDVEAIYYAYVKDHYDHRVEREDDVVKSQLLKRYPLIKANPPDLIKKLVRAGRRLDPNLDLPTELIPLQRSLYGGEKNADIPHYAFGTLGEFPWGVSSFMNRYCRQTMEDTHFIGEFPVAIPYEEAVNVRMFAVFDGHGGSKCAEFLSESLATLIKIYLEHLKSLSDLNIYNAVKLAFVEAHERFLDTDDKSGATAVVALVINGDLWIANIGDTRAVLSVDGTPVQLTEDQKPTTASIYPGIYKRGGKVVSGRIDIPFGSLAPGRAIGDKSFKGVNPRPKLTKLPLKELQGRSWLILACDGLWDVVGSARAVSLIERGQTAEEVVRILQDEAANLWTADNVTIMAVQLC